MEISSARRVRWMLAAIAGVAFVLRFAHIWQIRSAPFFAVLMGDARAYDEWAQRIAGGEWIGRDVFYQAPLYPYFLGVLYRVLGRDLLGVRVVQAIIGSLSCVCLAQAVRRWLRSDVAGIAAGFVLAGYAPAIFFDALIQKTVLDVFFVCVALWLLGAVAARLPANDTRVLVWLGLGGTLGALALTRENALALIVVVLGWAIVQRAVRGAAAFVIGLALILAPVAIRNYAVGGGFYLTTSQFGPNLYIGNHPGADGTYQPLRSGRGTPEFERIDATELAEHALGRTLSPSDVSAYWTDRAVTFATGQPGAWLRLLARKFALLWNADEMVDTESQESYAEWSWPLRLLGPVTHFGVLVPLAVLGAVVAWRLDPPLGLLTALTAAYAASVVLFYVFARYRFPLVPLLILFATRGLLALGRSSWNAQGLRPAVAATAAAAVFANWPLLSADTMRAVTESNLGSALQSERRVDDAIVHYQRAIAIKPDYAPAYSNLGTALRAAGRLDEAIATYRRAIEIQPDFPDAEYNLANALLAAGRNDEAIARFERSLSAIPASADAHNNLGVALAAQGRRDAAMREFEAALRLDPHSALTHRNIGDLLGAGGDRAGAIEHLRQATRLDPSDAAAHYDLGSELLEAGAFEEAAREFREAIARQPDSAEAHNNLGIALGSQGRLDDAIAQFREALRIRPGFADAERNLTMASSARRPPHSPRPPA